MNTTSQRAIETIRAAFNEAEELEAGRTFLSLDAAATVAIKFLKKSEAIDLSRMDLATATRVAQWLGKYRGIAISHGEKNEAVLAWARLGQVYRYLLVPNRDEARVAGSDLLEKASNAYYQLGERSYAGIELTNAALLIVEMHNPSREQLEYALTLFRRGQSLKGDNNRVDWAYSEFNIGICIKNIDRSNVVNLERSYKCLTDAYKVLSKTEAKANHRVAYLTEVADVLCNWWTATRNRYITELVSGNILTLLEPYRTPGLDRVQIFYLLRSNPRVLGLSETPEWAQTLPQPECGRVMPDPARLVDDLYQELESWRGSSECSRLRWYVHRVFSEVLDRDDVDDELATATNEIFDQGNQELFFIRASGLVHSDNISPAIREELLIRIMSCLEFFRDEWSAADVERFLMRNPVQLRFAACRLAQLGHWIRAFDMLELSRGLISSKSTGYKPVPMVGNSHYFWLHLTHGPDATYVAARYSDGGKQCTVGRSFPDISGVRLSELFSGPVGLLTAQHSEDSGMLSAAIDRILEVLDPVINWVKHNSESRHVVVMPGGFFQAFPIASRLFISSIGGNEREQLASIAPSMTVATSGISAYMPVREVGICVASDVAGVSPLKWAALERGFASSNSVNIKFFEVTGTAVDLVREMKSLDLVHFSGHSYAAQDPLDSALVLHGSQLSVREILGLSAGPRNCVLSSCQSGLSFNFTRQDEYLSIQSALFYSGATAVIGTLWPVRDFVAFVFGQIFYRHLDSGTAVAVAFFRAVRDLATLTVGRLRLMLADEVIDMPTQYSAIAEEERAFPHFRDHGAYTLMLRPLDIQ